MIKAVIFDFFGVICSDEYWQFVKEDRQEDSEYRAYTDEVNLGQIPWQVFVHKVADATGRTVQDVNKMYEAEKVDPRMVGLIHEIHESYKTALVTNAHHDFIDNLLAKYDLGDIFNELIVSSRLGIVKPNPQIFEYALEKLNVAASESIYIDDLQRHVDSAKALGMQAILFENFEQCKRDLDAFLTAG